MRINLIGNFAPNTGLQQDATIIRGILQIVYGEKVQIRKVMHYAPECSEADINIFLEVPNMSLLTFAGKNIWVPNTEWTFKTWIPLIPMFDEIWVKTREAETIFSKYSTNVKYVSWTSIDKVMPEKKNYSKAIVLVGKNIYRHPKPILKSYYELLNSDPELYKNLPILHIPYNPESQKIYCPEEIRDKVILLDKQLSEKDYTDLLQECGLAICTSSAEGFGHAINEAMSAGCNLILSDIAPFKELTNYAITAKSFNEMDHPECLGIIKDISSKEVSECLKSYVCKSFKHKQNISELVRSEYESRHAHFLKVIQEKVTSLNPEIYDMKNKFMPEEDLPDVSIITITKDRRIFMPLAKYSYLIQSYPEDKLEWVIVDDGEDSIEDTLIGIPNVKYVRCSPATIGVKRNLGVQTAMYDTIIMMDDDDVYPNNSILQRVAFLTMEPRKECTFCTTIPCYDICNYSSFVNVPPNTLPISQRISEATLCFTKKFWEERNFPCIQVGEGETFIHGREHMCREVSPQEVIVSLVHVKNTSSRKIPEIKEPNGCHYGFKEELFALVSEIGESLKAHAE